jgi:hypothetical protein
VPPKKWCQLCDHRTDSPPHKVALNCPTHNLADRHSQPNWIVIVHSDDPDRNQTKPTGPTRTTDALKRGLTTQRPDDGPHLETYDGGELRRQAGAAFEAASLQDCPACLGRHALAETMLFGPTTIVRLERALTHDDPQTLLSSGRAAGDSYAKTQ